MTAYAVVHRRYFYRIIFRGDTANSSISVFILKTVKTKVYFRKDVNVMITVNMAATGENIKNMMKARNIKVKDVQAVCGFGTPQAIFKWMRGDCMPTIDNMIIIADMFGVTMDDIVVVNK